MVIGDSGLSRVSVEAVRGQPGRKSQTLHFRLFKQMTTDGLILYLELN